MWCSVGHGILQCFASGTWIIYCRWAAPGELPECNCPKKRHGQYPTHVGGANVRH